MSIILGISHKNPDVLLEHIRGLHFHIKKQVILFKTMKMDEACVHEQYLENIGQKNGNPSGSKQKEHHKDSKERKNKCKWGKDNKTINIAH
jgi:hypothetical protein